MEPVWQLDPQWTFLNHGSFGARLERVATEQERWRRRLERQPLRFMLDEYLPELEKVRRRVAQLAGAPADEVVLVPNATYGVSSVLRSLKLSDGDELIVLEQAYGACRAALDYVAERAGARVVVVSLPVPIASDEAVVAQVLEAVTERTRFALLDAVISPTGWVLPIERLVAELKQRQVETLVDAAHSPGLTPMALTRCGAAFTAANLHKWTCAPLGSAFLHVRKDLRDEILPCALSHGMNLPVAERWHDCYDWTGTFDPSAWLSIPLALDALEACHPEGLTGLMRRNNAMAQAGADLIRDRLGFEPTAPRSMFAAMVSVVLPLPTVPKLHHLATDPLQRRLIEAYQIEVPVMSCSGRRILRLSCQQYTTQRDLERLVEALEREVTQMPH